MAEIVYVLCMLSSTACAVMLFRRYRMDHSKILLWSCLCFCLLALNNVVLLIDMTVFADVDFGGSFWRNLLGALAGSVLLFGLIWEIT